MKLTKLAFAALAALAACGPMGENSGAGNFVKGVQGLASSLIAGPAEPVEVAPLSREQLAATGVPMMVMVLPSRNATAAMAQISDAGGRKTWMSPDGISVTTQDGIVVATRGLGDDLMGADVDGVLSAIRNGGTVQRTHAFLSGEDQIIRPTLTCTYKKDADQTITILGQNIATTRMAEDCENAQIAFKNYYWLANSGEIVQTQQWISYGVGHLATQRP